MATLFSNIIKVDQTVSTNSYASKLLKIEKAKEGTVIFANFQTKGEGQRGEIWQSEYGKNILTSMIISPKISIKDQFNVTTCIALSLFDLMSKYFYQKVTIKWPNDILVADKKIAGILIQNVVSRGVIKDAIVGVGINVNQKRFSDYSTKATSFVLELEKEVSLSLLQNQLMLAVEARYLQFQEGKMKEMKSEFLENLFGFDLWRNYIVDDQEVKAKIIGIDEYGRLILRFQNDSINAFSLKEIVYSS